MVAWSAAGKRYFSKSPEVTQRQSATRTAVGSTSPTMVAWYSARSGDEQHGLGDAPELHTWVMEKDDVDRGILEQATEQSGAVIMGRRLFDTVNAPEGWNEKMGYGADQTGSPPFFVVTHSPPAPGVRLERELGMSVTFVTDLSSSIEQAAAAATDGNVVIMGGGDLIGQAVEQGLIDELRLHLSPMVLGGGTPLFKSGARQLYRQADVRASRNAVHMTYERL